MKRLLVAVTLFALWALPGTAVGRGSDWIGAEYLPGRLIVNFRESAGAVLHDKQAAHLDAAVTIGVPSVDALFTRYRVATMSRIVDDKTLALLAVVPDFFRTVALDVPQETDILAMIDEFERDPNVDYVEPDLLRPVLDREPNDPLWQAQWDKRLMNCPPVWDFSTGSREIIMVAIDGGVWWRHPDLKDNLWINEGEDANQNGVLYTDTTFPGDQEDINGYDDDLDGKDDDFIGWDFMRGVPQSQCWPGEDCDNVEDNDPTSIEDHGTHVTGLMGAVGNNGVGVAGVNWNARVIAIRCGYKPADHNIPGLINSASATAGITWATARGARIINMSYGSDFPSTAEAQAINASWANGAILVGAAGNDSVSTIHYPAAHANVVAVGSVSNDDVLSDFSNFGTWVDIYSPGDMVTSTVIPGYAAYPGTSMASPNAAGVFGLLWSILPNYSNQDLVDLVFAHCIDISALNPDHPLSDLGHGRIDALLPLQTMLPKLAIANFAQSGDNDGDGRLEPGETASVVLTLQNDVNWQPASNLQVVVTTEDPFLILGNESFNGGVLAPGASFDNAASPLTLTVTPEIPQSHWATLKLAISGDYDYYQELTFLVEIGRPPVLLVADDGVFTYHSFFESALRIDAITEYIHDVWSVTAQGEPQWSDIQDYRYILWVCGNDSVTSISTENRAMLAQFLDAGGRLFLAGQGVDEQLAGSSFYSDYLHCQSAGLPGTLMLHGELNDPISAGTRLLLIGGGCAGNGNVGPDEIVPLGDAVGFYKYDLADSGFGAVRYDNGVYKTAFYAFALESACGSGGSTHHTVTIRNTLNWLGAEAVSADPPRATPRRRRASLSTATILIPSIRRRQSRLTCRARPSSRCASTTCWAAR